MAFVLATEVQLLADRFDIKNLGFLTLTFADPVNDIAEAQRRFNSLNTHVLKARYKRAIATVERQGSGRLHYHLVVALGADIRSGVDFKAVSQGDYRSAGQALRAEWAFWRRTARNYGFGRTELLPVKSTAEGIARYVGKYISKHIDKRKKEDIGARLVRFLGYQKGDRCASANFAWNTDGAWLWRHKLKAWAESKDLADTEAIKSIYGPRWAYILKDTILTYPLENVVFPSLAAANRNVTMQDPLTIARYKAEQILLGQKFVTSYLLGKRIYHEAV